MPVLAANLALPWIVFARDRSRFEAEFPSLQIRRLELGYPFRYLCSGGIAHHALLPTCCYDLIARLEDMLSPLAPLLSLFTLIVIERTRDSA